MFVISIFVFTLINPLMCNVFELQTHVSLFLHYGDLSDSTNLFHIISTVKPHEIYNLGAMSHVAVSIEINCLDSGSKFRLTYINILHRFHLKCLNILQR